MSLDNDRAKCAGAKLEAEKSTIVYIVKCISPYCKLYLSGSQNVFLGGDGQRPCQVRRGEVGGSRET